MNPINKGNVADLVNQLEKLYQEKQPSFITALFNGFKVAKVADSKQQEKLNQFKYQNQTGHPAFVAALSACPDKSILGRGIEIIKNDRYTGCAESEKQQLLEQLSDAANGSNPAVPDVYTTLLTAITTRFRSYLSYPKTAVQTDVKQCGNQKTIVATSLMQPGSQETSGIADSNPNGSSVAPITFDHQSPPPAKKQKPQSMERESHPSDSEGARQKFGGKGMFLKTMQEMKLPVPPFQPIDIALIKCFESEVFSVDKIKSFIPDLSDQPSDTSLQAIADQIEQFNSLESIKREKWLSGLAQFITSNDFYQVIQRSAAAPSINESYQQLQQQCPGQPVIVRSSGTHEDDYGDAQAGKFDSHVKGAEPILKTCLNVLASGYQPAICQSGKPQPLAMVMQACIPCASGGVVLSHSSLQDERINVEYAPGQPRTVVAGSGELTPHRYRIDRAGAPDKTQWQTGVIPAIYQLQQDSHGAWSEQKIPYFSKDAGSETLSSAIQDQLVNIIRQLEDRLFCPVDVEFAVGQDGKLYILQVRPVTRLSGGNRYAKAQPSAPLLTGQLVSEGCCSGESVYVDRPTKPEALPKGAVLYANHGADWMLAPDVLKKVGGFVLAKGGTNDHVAITLRQAGKPCLIAGEQLRQIQDKSTVTLVAGNFQGTESACIVPGDQEAEWLACRTTLSQDYEPALNRSKQYQPVHPSFQRPQEGFAWLSQQNDRLLNYFSTNRLFHQCLSPEQSKLLSMSGQRADVVRQLQTEVDYFCEDADALLQGYQQFLNLAGETEDAAMVDYRNELPVLRDKLHLLTANIKRMATDISSAFLDNQSRLNIDSYSEWLTQCQVLKSTLQDLNQPAGAATINSLHDFIFLVHKRFVDGLGPVAEHSGQGKVIGFGHEKIQGKWLDFISPGNVGLLNPDIRDALKAFDGEVTILNLPTAFRLNARLGVHVCEAAMFEQAEGGKGRKIKLSLSDNFSRGHASGKYKRCFFLVSCLLAGGMDRNRMTLNFDRATGKLSLDYAPIGSQEEMQRFYALSVSLLGGMQNLDIDIDIDIDDNPEWNFESLETRIDQSDWDIESFMPLFLRHCMIDTPYYHRLDMVYRQLDELQLRIEDLSTADDLLINAYQEFKKQGREREFRAFIRVMADEYADIAFPLLTPYPQLMALLNPDEIPISYAGSAAGDNKQLVKNALSHGEEDVFKYVSERLLNDRHFILELIEQYPTIMDSSANSDVWLRQWGDDQELLMAALRTEACQLHQLKEEWKNNKPFVLALAASGVNIEHAGDDIKYDRDVFMAWAPQDIWALAGAPEALKNDREVVLSVVSRVSFALQYASQALKNDRSVILAACRSDGSALQYASQALKNDRKVVLAACRSEGSALKYASEEFKNDKALVLELVSRDGTALTYVSDALKNDPDVFIAALKKNYNNRKHLGAAWKQNREAVLAVVRQHGYLLNKVADAFKQDAEIVSAAMERHPFAFEFAGDWFKDNVEYVRKAIASSGLNIKYASDRFRGDKQLVLDVIKQHGGNVLEHVSDELKNDSQVVLTALQHWTGRWGCPIKFASRNLQRNQDFVTAAVKLNPKAFEFSHSDLRGNIKFIKQLLHIDTRILQYAARNLRNDEQLVRLSNMKNPLN